MMVVGESGSGRSTFINSLCDQLIVEPSYTLSLYTPEDLGNHERELQLRKSIAELEDDEGVRISLNIIDTPGFGGSLNNDQSFQIIQDYLKHQFDEILIEESKLRRNPRFRDGRVHCCLYFITPTGHGLKEIDIEMMLKLGELVNILPVISKSDSLTINELKLNKKLIMEDIKHYNIPIFNFINEYFANDESMDDETLELCNYLESNLPFAIMGSNLTIEDSETKKIKRVREYPWGVIDIFDNEISDVALLKSTLLVTHLNDLKDYTHEVLYENYRTKALGNDDYDENNHTSNLSNISSIANNSTSIANNTTATATAGNTLDSNVYNSNGNGFNTKLGINGNGVDSNGNRQISTSTTNGTPYEIKEEQIRLEEERLRAFEDRVQRDLLLKRQEIEAREKELAEIEKRLAQETLN
ncbi:unnamed protein product [[Candida] boidinii]|nr:unnamed protein product [[Candida] boidinii]